MKTLAAAFITLVPICSFAGSEQAVLLSPIQEKNITVSTVNNIYGKCGDRVVAIFSVSTENFNGQDHFNIDVEHQRYFSIDYNGNPDLVIRGGLKEYSYKWTLSDFNIVHCVQTNDGFRLLVGGSCGGSGCSDTTRYYIIDVNNGNIFPNKNSEEECDEKCVNKALRFKYLPERQQQ